MLAISSYKQAFEKAIRLFIDSYVPLLPFLIAFAAFSFLVDYFYPVQPNAVTKEAFFVVIVTQIVVMLFFNFIIHGVYQYHNQQKIAYHEAILQGAKRFFPMLFAMFFIFIPILIMGIIAVIALTMGMGLGTLTIFFGAVAIYGLIIVIYCYFTAFLVVCKNRGPWQGIKESIQVVKGHWLALLLVILIMSAVIGGFYYVMYLMMGMILAKAILLLLSFSLGPCVMVVFYELLSSKKTA